MLRWHALLSLAKDYVSLTFLQAVGIGDNVYAAYLEEGIFQAEIVGFPDNKCELK